MQRVSLPFVSLAAGLFMLCAIAGADEPVPSWQLGISEWNGKGYDLPKPVRKVDPVTSGPGLPYTMPVDPKTGATADVPQYEMPLADPRPTIDGNTRKFNFPIAADLAPADPGTAVDPKPIENPGPSVEAADPPSAQEIPALPRGNGANDDPVTEKLNSQAAVETPPLQEEIIRWYEYPRRWMRGWDSHAEFGLDGSSGNSDTLALQTGLEVKRKTDDYTLAMDVDYRQASSRNVTVEDNGRFNLDYDHIFHDSPWSGFAKYGMEWDKFKAFDLRLNINSGLGYFWIRDDTTTLVTRFGAGASKEIGAPVDDWIPEAVFGIEAERQLTARQKLKGKVDYFPAWENFDDYRLVTDLAWEILLDGSENLSLKLAATDRYDSTPQGAQPNDLYYSLLLLYKF